MANSAELMHFSPAAVVLPNDVGPIIDVAHSIRNAHMTRSDKRLGAIDITTGGIESPDETAEKKALREAVDACLPTEPAQERIIRLRLITDAAKVVAWRLSNPGIPNNVLHTDFRRDKKPFVTVFRRRNWPRTALVIDGDATIVTSGTLEATVAEEFTANGLDYNLSAEQQMANHAPALYGADGQLIRGPVDSNSQFALTGDHETVMMPSEQWYELSPTTAHEIPPYLAYGRMIISVDRES